jgi:hypothetical protein
VTFAGIRRPWIFPRPVSRLPSSTLCYLSEGFLIFRDFQCLSYLPQFTVPLLSTSLGIGFLYLCHFISQTLIAHHLISPVFMHLPEALDEHQLDAAVRKSVKCPKSDIQYFIQPGRIVVS